MPSDCHWLKRSSFSNAWWWPSEPPRMRMESRLDSRFGR